MKREVDALGVITISRGCFERCCSNKKTPPYYSNLIFVTLRTRRPTLLCAPAYRTPSEASPRRRCGHASRFLWGVISKGDIGTLNVRNEFVCTFLGESTRTMESGSILLRGLIPIGRKCAEMQMRIERRRCGCESLHYWLSRYIYIYIYIYICIHPPPHPVPVALTFCALCWLVGHGFCGSSLRCRQRCSSAQSEWSRIARLGAERNEL